MRLPEWHPGVRAACRLSAVCGGARHLHSRVASCVQLRAPAYVLDHESYPSRQDLQMDADDSSRLPLAGPTMPALFEARRGLASVPSLTHFQPIAPVATRRGVLMPQ